MERHPGRKSFQIRRPQGIAVCARGALLASVFCLTLSTLSCGRSATGPGGETLRRLWSRADRGNLSAQRELGCAFRDGTRMRQDYREAAKWFRIAAEQGDAIAQVGLGDLYEHGKGLPEDGTAALTWYRLAAKQGHVPALYALGRMYREGQSVPQETVQIYKWLHLAETLAISTDTANFIARERDGIGRRMQPGEIAEARRAAQEWLEQFIRGQRSARQLGPGTLSRQDT